MRKVVFVIGSVGISGGTYVIFQHALYLKQQGYDVTIACCIEYDKYLSFQKKKTFWHPGLIELKIISVENIDSFYDVAIYTWWRTVYYLPQIASKFCVYFIQSIESRFYNPKDTHLIKLVDKTYTFGLPVITEASWIQSYLQKQYNVQSLIAKNGISKEYFTPNGEAICNKSNMLRVLIEGPLGVSFKNTERTITICSKVSNIEVWLLTSSPIDHYPSTQKVFSEIAVDKVANIYRSCDVLVKLSYVEGMFAPPLEMFHCGGTCIVYNVTGYDEYIRHGYNGIVLNTDDEKGVIDALNQLKNDRNHLNQLKKGAVETAKQWQDWGEASRVFHECLEHLICHSNNKDQSDYYQSAIKQAFKDYELAMKRQAGFLSWRTIFSWSSKQRF